MDKKVFRILKCLVDTREPLKRNQAIPPFSIMGQSHASRVKAGKKGARTRKRNMAKHHRKKRR